MKKLIVFDLDGTLAESKSPLDAEMSWRLGVLLSVVDVAVISGGDWPQFERQLLPDLPRDGRLKRLSLLPTSGTKFYGYAAGWTRLYCDDLSPAEKGLIVDRLERAVRLTDFKIRRTWGAQIEDRGSQITFSALGQQAPVGEKRGWDPDFSKRRAMKAALDALLPGYSVRVGGATSVDITKPGVDKAYGIKKLREMLGVRIGEMVFIGDALFPGGNDYPALEAGATCIPVDDPEETKWMIEAVAASFCCRGAGRLPASGARSSPRRSAPSRRP